LHVDQIDLTLEVVFGTDGQLDRHRSVTQTLLDLTDMSMTIYLPTDQAGR
jgi:hypothetical protein